MLKIICVVNFHFRAFNFHDYNKSWVAFESIVYVTEESESPEEFKVAINLNPTKLKSHSLLYIP